METVLLVLGGLWLLERMGVFRAASAATASLERGGASAYDWLHSDKGHRRDLPGHQMTHAALVELARAAGFPDPKLAVAIAMAESGGVPNAITDTRGSVNLPHGTIAEYSIGLWQINLLAHPEYTREDMSDPQKNAAAAFKISHGGQNWRPWSTFTSGAYKRYMEANA